MIIGSSSKSLIHFRLDMMIAFSKLGLQVVACCPQDEDFEKVRTILRQHHINLLPVVMNNTEMNPYKDIKSFISLYRTIKQVNPGYILLYTIKPVIYGSLAAKLGGVETIVSMMSGLGHFYTVENFTTRTMRKIMNALYKLAFLANKGVLFQNPDDLDLFKKLGLIKRVKTKLIAGSGVNLQTFPESPLPPLDPFTFLFIGRLLETKGIKEFCKAAHLIKTRYPNTHFHILGGLHSNPGRIEQSDLSNLLEDSGVQYLGEQESSLSAIQQSHVVVLPSYREGVPKALLEALAVGRPIITTDVPGCRETVIDQKNGFLVPARDIQALADAMEKLIQNPHDLTSMGKESRKLAESRFDVCQVNQQIIEFLGLSGADKT